MTFLRPMNPSRVRMHRDRGVELTKGRLARSMWLWIRVGAIFPRSAMAALIFAFGGLVLLSLCLFSFPFSSHRVGPTMILAGFGGLSTHVDSEDINLLYMPNCIIKKYPKSRLT